MEAWAGGQLAARQKWSRGPIEARLTNLPPSLIGTEVCVGHIISPASSPRSGTMTRLMPAKYVRPYAKGQKNDFNDAEAIAQQ